MDTRDDAYSLRQGNKERWVDAIEPAVGPLIMLRTESLSIEKDGGKYRLSHFGVVPLRSLSELGACIEAIDYLQQLIVDIRRAASILAIEKGLANAERDTKASGAGDRQCS